MKKIVVEAFQDPSRPQGGHAVIMLRGLADMPDRPSIRLRPVEAELGGAAARGLWRGGRLQPLATRATTEGIELVIGPDVVGHPHLLAGTPVIIEVPEADIRGEFLWPAVTPLAQPRRRHVVVPRSRRGVGVAVAMPAPANDAHPAAAGSREAMPAAASAAVAGNLAIRSDLDAVPAESATLAPAPATQAQPIAPPPLPPMTAPADEAGAEGERGASAETGATAIQPPPLPPMAKSAVAPATATGAPAKAKARPTGELSWTPGREPRGDAGRNYLRAGLALAALLALVVYLQAPRKLDPDLQLSERFARPPATQKIEAPREAAPPAKPAKPEPARDGGGATVTLAPVAAALKPAAQSCAAPDVQTEPLAAGRMRVTVAAGCKGREDVHLVYGGADRVARLDDDGRLTWTLDAFAGDKEALEIRFADGTRHAVPIKVRDLDRVSKVAVIWRTPVELNLHAFEYAALPGGRGHIWAGAAGSAEIAEKAAAAEHKGRGYLSTVNHGGGAGDRLEVYTFLHADEQAGGAVGLALDHATRGEAPAESTCGKGELAEVPYTVVVMARGAAPRRESGLIAAAPCGVRLGPEVRFRQTAMPVLRIKK